MKNQIVLQNAMIAKAAFYGITCVFLCLFSSNFAELFGSASANLVFGFGLVFFNLSALTIIALLKGNMEDNVAKLLITADILMVIVFFGALATQILPFNVNGYIFTGMTATSVACLAYAQHYGLKYKIERMVVTYRELEVVTAKAA